MTDSMLRRRQLRDRLGKQPIRRPSSNPPPARPAAKPAPREPKVRPAPAMGKPVVARQPKPKPAPRLKPSVYEGDGRPRLYWQRDEEGTQHNLAWGGRSIAWALILQDGDKSRKITVVYARAMPSPEDAATLWRNIRHLLRDRAPADPVVVGLGRQRPHHA